MCHYAGRGTRGEEHRLRTWLIHRHTNKVHTYWKYKRRTENERDPLVTLEHLSLNDCCCCYAPIISPSLLYFLFLYQALSLSLKVEIALTPKGNKGLCFGSVPVEHAHSHTHTGFGHRDSTNNHKITEKCSCVCIRYARTK